MYRAPSLFKMWENLGEGHKVEAFEERGYAEKNEELFLVGCERCQLHTLDSNDVMFFLRLPAQTVSILRALL